jgi:hypothetical protein
MHPLLLLGGVGAAVWAWTTTKGGKLPPGQNPFDAFPLGVNGADPVSTNVYTASSGRRYTITTFAASDGRTYAVAQKKGDVDWLSYFLSTNTGGRVLWAANADHAEEIDGMLADFSLTRGGVT